MQFMRKYGTARQATDDNTMWHVSFAYWITKATNQHTQKMQYSLLFHGNNGYTITPQCYVISTLPVLFLIVLWPLKYSYTLLFSADVHVQLCSTDGHSLHNQTSL